MLYSTARSHTLATLAFCLLLGSLSTGARADWKDDVGYTQLVSELGTVPTGAGVKVSQVEADLSSTSDIDYLPDLSNNQFLGKSISDGSGDNEIASNHATTAGKFFYGNTSSIAPGVTNITGYESNDYLNSVLGYATAVTPEAQNFKVQNHSWIGTASSQAAAVSMLQRLDYTIDSQEMTVLVGLNNGNGAVPELLGHSYNALAIGLTSNNFSNGLTTFYGSGRSKPSLVAPSGATSWATAMVSSATAMLHESASGTAASRSETMRAILMAGATKSEFANWSHTTSQPLDTTYGAGELNVRNSYYIQAGGEYNGSGGAPATSGPSFGWDYNSGLAAGAIRNYSLVVPAGKYAGELSAVLTWNVEVTDTESNPFIWLPTYTLANLDLELFDSTSGFANTLLASSLSTVDNVEHIYEKNFGPGVYTLRVSGDSERDYALAWRMPLFDLSDTDQDGDIDTADLTTIFQNFTGDLGTGGGKIATEGDADLDGDVDTFDITYAMQNFTGSMPDPLVAFSSPTLVWDTNTVSQALQVLEEDSTQAVPEPGTLWLLLLGVGGLLAGAWWRRKRLARV